MIGRENFSFERYGRLVFEGEYDHREACCFEWRGCGASIKCSYGEHLRQLQAVDAVRIDGVIFKRDRIVLLESFAEESIDLGIVAGLHDEFAAVAERADFTFFDRQLAPFDHVPRIAEHALAIGIVVVDGEIAVGPDAEVSLLLHAQRAGGTGVVMMAISSSVYSRFKLGQHDAAERGFRQRLDALAAEVCVHQQVDNLGIAPETGTVRMIGREENAPGIGDQQ